MKPIVQQTARTGYWFVMGVISIPHAGENMSCGIRWSLLRGLNILFGARRSTFHFTVTPGFVRRMKGPMRYTDLLIPPRALWPFQIKLFDSIKAKRFALRSTGKRLGRKTLLLDTPPVSVGLWGMRRHTKVHRSYFRPWSAVGRSPDRNGGGVLTSLFPIFAEVKLKDAWRLWLFSCIRFNMQWS